MVQTHDLPPDADDAALLARLVTAAEVNAAAQAMAGQRTTAVRRSMDTVTRRLERGGKSARNTAGGALAIGEPMGRDGNWADLWERARGAVPREAKNVRG